MPPARSSQPGNPALGRSARRPTLNDIAQALGVSRATVSNAFNRPELLSPHKLSQITSYAASVGYFGPDPMARALRRHELREVAVVFHHDLRYALSDPQAIEFLQGVAAELDERELVLQLIPKMGRRPWLAAAFQTTADALIIHAEITHELMPQLRGVHKPLVLVDTHLDDMATVRIDDCGGAYQAMRHVLSRQPAPQRLVVACLPVGPDEWARVAAQPFKFKSGIVGGARLSGYLQALHEARFPLDRVTWLELDDAAPEAGLERVLQAIGSTPGNTGVVCMSDRIALAILAARPAGSPQCPWSSLVGFDDVAEAALRGLSSVRQDSVLKGRAAVRAVLDGTPSPVLPVELVVRDT